MHVVAGNAIQVSLTTYQPPTNKLCVSAMMSISCCTTKISLQLQQRYVATLTATSQHCGYGVVSADWQRLQRLHRVHRVHRLRRLRFVFINRLLRLRIWLHLQHNALHTHTHMHMHTNTCNHSHISAETLRWLCRCCCGRGCCVECGFCGEKLKISSRLQVVSRISSFSFSLSQF